MKTTRIATLIPASLQQMPKYIKSYRFIELYDEKYQHGFVYQIEINGEIKSTVHSNRNIYDDMVFDARKAIYHKWVRGIGQFSIDIICNVIYDKKTKQFIQK